MNQIEKALNLKKQTIVAGVDEVGRGPLAGPVVAACVVLPPGYNLKEIKDSKQLSVKKREALAKIIKKEALAYAIVAISVRDIDKLNIYQATKKAMTKAIKLVAKKIAVEHVLIDAVSLNLDIDSTVIIKGDQKSISIAAASIIAKVYRDGLMMKIDQKYPQYEFKNHKGYATKRHLELIKKYGVVACHRCSFKPVKEALDES